MFRCISLESLLTQKTVVQTRLASEQRQFDTRMRYFLKGQPNKIGIATLYYTFSELSNGLL